MAKRHSQTHQVLTKADVFKSMSLHREEVPVEKLGGKVLMQELSGRKYLVWKERMKRIGGDDTSQQFNLMAILISMVVVNEDGTPMFTEEEALTLADNSYPAFEELADKCLAHSGMPKKAEARNNPKNDQTSSTTNSPTS